MATNIYAWWVMFILALALLCGTVFSFDLIRVVDIGNVYDLKRFLALVFIVLSSVGFFLVREIELPQVDSYKIFIFFAVFLSLISSSLLSKHTYWGLVEVANICLLIFVTYMLTACIKAIHGGAFYKWLLGFVLLFSILTFVKYIVFLSLFYFDGDNFNIHSLVSGYVNVRFFNQLQVMLVPVLMLPFTNESMTKFRSISLFVLSLHWMILFQTEARGAILSLLSAFFLLIYFLPLNSRKELIYIVLKSIAFGFIFWLIFIICIPSWIMDGANFQLKTGSSGRIDMWLYVLDSIPERLWFGFGPMSFIWAADRPLANAHPHNSIIQILYEYGLIICIALTFCIAAHVIKNLALLKTAVNHSSIIINFAVLSGLIYSLFSGVFVMPLSQLVFVFLIAVQMQYVELKYFTPSRFAILIAIAAVFIFFCGVLGSYKSSIYLDERIPRMWLYGLL